MIVEVKVCVGSACYVKGSKQVIEVFQKYIKDHGLEEQIELKATFCLGYCTQAVAVMLDDKVYGVTPTEAYNFCENIILKEVGLCK